jgi:phage-related protein
MANVYFYKTAQGKEPVRTFIEELARKKDKKNENRLRKVLDCIEYLKIYGKRLGMPYAKKIDKDLWELRPTSDRILYGVWRGEDFVLLSNFVKKTVKTPKAEKEKARRRLKEYERSKDL